MHLELGTMYRVDCHGCGCKKQMDPSRCALELPRKQRNTLLKRLAQKFSDAETTEEQGYFHNVQAG